MSGGYPGGEGGQRQGVEGGIAGGGGGSCLPFYHVPQQCRREKLRYPIANDDEVSPLHPYLPMPLHPLLHYNAPVSFVSPASSFGHLLNPGGGTSDPYDHGAVPAFNLLEPHALIGGDVLRQGQGVSLSLFSPVATTHHSQSHHTHHLFGAPTPGGPQPQMPAVAPGVRPVPAGPFTGYATILKGSRFLRPAQHLLEEVCCSGMGALVGGGGEAEPSDFAAETLDDCQKIADGPLGGEYRRMKAKLVSMLDEVYRRYKFYYQQIQAVLSSFEAVAGLTMAAPYAPLALKSLSRHFCCLKHQISDQIRMTDEAFGKENQGKNGVSGCGYKNGDFGYQRPGFSSCQASPQPVWRPQRGLPERAVSVLRAWLFEHFLHPYPSDMDKQMLAKQTGLSRNQVSNWFINARVRLWKPMVEEIHSLETRRALKLPGTDNDGSGSSNDKKLQPELSNASGYSADEQTRRLNASPPRDDEYPPHKRFHGDRFAHVTEYIPGPVAFPDLDDVAAAACRERGGVPMGVANGSVSLTLGLHQSNGVRRSEPLPLNVVRRFGLDDTNAAWVGGQERQSSKEFFDGHRFATSLLDR